MSKLSKEPWSLGLKPLPGKHPENHALYCRWDLHSVRKIFLEVSLICIHLLRIEDNLLQPGFGTTGIEPITTRISLSRDNDVEEERRTIA